MSTRTREIIGKAILETLENRQMLSTVTLTDGVLIVQGNSSSPNNLSIHTANNKVWAVTDNGPSQKIAVSNVRQIRIIGGEREDSVFVEAGVRIPVYVQTGNGNDTITTGSGPDTVKSGNGRDLINAGAGNDLIDAGNDNDTINAGSGHDTIEGNDGSDVIDDGKGNDVIIAGSGDDRAHSGAGRDRIRLGTGKDRATGISELDAVESEKHDAVDRLPIIPVGDNNTPPTSKPGNGGNDTTQETPATIKSFTLINAETNQPVAGYTNLSGSVTLDLSKLPTKKLNIIANYDPSFGGSVVFGYNSDKRFSVENLAPWSFNHDLYGDYYAWTPKVGTHTVSATTYSGKDGTGKAGATVKLQLIVKQSADNQPNPKPESPNPQPKPDPVVEPTPDPTPGSDAPYGVVSVIDSNITVDHAVHVNGISSNLKAGTLLTAKFQWDFGDPDSKFNKLVGWSAAHQYTKPGQYKITLTITNENGKTSSVSKTINVGASERKVIYVSNSGSDSNSGLSPQSAVKSFDKAMSLVGNNTEVLFNRGETFSFDKGTTIDNTDVVIGSYGKGAKPVLRYTGPKNYASIITTNGKSRNVTIRDVTFDSVHDKNQEKTGMPDAVHAGGDNLSIIGVTFLNIGYGVNANLKPKGVLVQECDAPDEQGLRSYLSYVQGEDFAFIGNHVANVTREHCIRVDGADRVLIAHNDFTNQDRRPMGDKLDTAKQTITVHHGNYAYIYGNTTTGGRVEIGPLGEGDGLKPKNIVNRLNWVRIEANDFDFSAQNRLEIDHGTKHVMVINNRIRVVNGSGIVVQAAGKYTNWSDYGDRRVEDVIITGDNEFSGAKNNVSVGRGAVGVKVLPSGSPVYTLNLGKTKLAA